MDAHAEHHLRLGACGRRGRPLGARLGVEHDAHCEAMRAGPIGDPCHIVRDLDVEGDGIGTRRGELLEVMHGVVDH